MIFLKIKRRDDEPLVRDFVVACALYADVVLIVFVWLLTQ